MNRWTRFTLCLLLLPFILTPPAWGLTEVRNLRHWASPEHTRVVIDTAEEIKFTSEKSSSKLTLNLLNATLSKNMPPEYILNVPGIVKIALNPLTAGIVRVEIFVTDNVNTHVFQLKKLQDKPYRVVVDITLPEVEKEKSQAREQVKVIKKDKIIVIDPGHGGEDPGAIGRRGTMEKEVVLAMGLKLRDILNGGQGTRAFLTRNDDYYVPFKKRLSFARELGADLFISIHADASRNRFANGSSVYSLSTGGASSEAARILARNENMADIIGGTISEEESDDESNPIILNMFQTNTINRSKAFGGKILDTLCRVNDIKFSRVQEAPFRVLKLPEIPAILIETAYISNPREELKLRDDKFQTAVARSITESVREFFSLPALPAPVLTEEDDNAKLAARNPAPEKQQARVSTHTVKKGETLTRIAAQYGLQISTLLELNNMKLQDPLPVGRQLLLSVPDGDWKNEKSSLKAGGRAKKPPVRTARRLYKVKKGDTLVKIARRHHVSVSDILKLNRMRLRDPLYVGRVLSFPSS